jgi:methyltransferase (TIGR00027 family)
MGARTSAIARTKLIDDAVCDALDEGTTQVVLLGAGFDSRAYRLARLTRGRVFELDRPATQKQKILVLTRGLGQPANHVVHIPIDFQTQPLASALCAAGFDSQARSLIVWEGVTNYLSESAVDLTVRAISNVVAFDSRLVFTYVDRGLLDGSRQFVGGRQILERMREIGEPWTFGFEPKHLAAFLAERGWQLIEDLSADEYRARYFGTTAARAMSGYSFYRTAIARRTATSRP